MRRALVLLLLLAPALTAATPPIDAERLIGHIQFLASDDMKGRAAGSPELERAADYIAQQFNDIGLKPGGDNGTWFEPFGLVAGLTVGEGNSLVVSDKRSPFGSRLGRRYYPLSTVPNEQSTIASERVERLPLVFAGYGLSAPDASYDDYAGLDVNGKAVIIFSHEPQEADPNSPLNGNRPMPQTTRVQESGGSTHPRRTSAARRVGSVAQRPIRGFTTRSRSSPDADEAGYARAAGSPRRDAAAARRVGARRAGAPDRSRPCGRDHARSKTRRSITPNILARNRRTVRNVVGVMPGSDPVKAREAIVIGAHYDHVGLGGRLSVTPERAGEIHNGADDNASGTASIIEIARAAIADRARFPRTLIFVAFAGEERGLLGSAHYVQSPPVSRSANTVAMLNLDMVGRSRGAVDVSGLERANAEGRS